MAKVELTPEAAEQLERLELVIHRRVLGILERLEDWPAVSGAKPLKRNLAGHYRIRTGKYRVQFRVADDVVTVEHIGHREGFYED